VLDKFLWNGQKQSFSSVQCFLIFLQLLVFSVFISRGIVRIGTEDTDIFQLLIVTIVRVWTEGDRSMSIAIESNLIVFIMLFSRIWFSLFLEFFDEALLFPQFKSHKNNEADCDENYCQAEVVDPFVIGRTRILGVIIDCLLCVQDCTFSHIQLTFHCCLFLKIHLKNNQSFFENEPTLRAMGEMIHQQNNPSNPLLLH